MAAPSPRSRLRALALRYPEAREDFPWGESVIKVRNKVFVFLGKGEPFSLSVKLPHSSALALSLPFATPTAYGLGKSGWVTALFDRRKPPLDLLAAWIDESYRAVAPKTLVKTLPDAGAESGGRPGRPLREPAGRKPRRS